MTAFDDMVGALFADANMAVDATYAPAAGGSSTVRAILRRPDPNIAGFGIGAYQPALVIDVQAAQVADPTEGDAITVGAFSYTVRGRSSDEGGLVWTLDVQPA